MSAKTPTVSVLSWGGREAAWLEDPGRPDCRVRLDSPEWFAWLEEPAATRFAYPIFDPRRGYITGVMTVRKERRQRGGSYWVVYRRCGTRVRKVYLGRAAGVTNTRVAELARAFLTSDRPRHGDEPATVSSY